MFPKVLHRCTTRLIHARTSISPLGNFVSSTSCGSQICQTFLALSSSFSLVSNRGRWHREWRWGIGSCGYQGPLIRRSLMDTYYPSVATAWVCMESLWTLVYDQVRYKGNKIEIKENHWKFCNHGQRCEWRRKLTMPWGAIRSGDPYVKGVCGPHLEEHRRLQQPAADFRLPLILFIGLPVRGTGSIPRQCVISGCSISSFWLRGRKWEPGAFLVFQLQIKTVVWFVLGAQQRRTWARH